MNFKHTKIKSISRFFLLKNYPNKIKDGVMKEQHPLVLMNSFLSMVVQEDV